MPPLLVRLNLPGFSSPEPFRLASAPPSMAGLACAVLEEIGGFSKEELQGVRDNLERVPLTLLGELCAGQLVELASDAELEVFLATAESPRGPATIEVRPRNVAAGGGVDGSAERLQAATLAATGQQPPQPAEAGLPRPFGCPQLKDSLGADHGQWPEAAISRGPAPKALQPCTPTPQKQANGGYAGQTPQSPALQHQAPAVSSTSAPAAAAAPAGREQRVRTPEARRRTAPPRGWGHPSSAWGRTAIAGTGGAGAHQALPGKR